MGVRALVSVVYTASYFVSFGYGWHCEDSTGKSPFFHQIREPLVSLDDLSDIQGPYYAFTSHDIGIGGLP